MSTIYLWCAGHKDWLPSTHAHTADVCRVEAVNILVDADSVEDAALINMLGEGQLHEDAMNLGVGVVGFHDLS